MNQQNKSPDKAKRVYLRIASNIPAYIFFKGKFIQKVFINDLSATGVGFFASGANLPGDTFEFRFRLSPLSPRIKTQIIIRNSTPIHGGSRIGCSFEKISLADQKSINRYLCRYTDYWSSYQAVNAAAFFCLIDVVARGFLWVFLAYFEVTKMNQALISVLIPRLPLLFYIFYGLSSLLAFVFSDSIFIKKGVKYLGLSLLCLLPSFGFVLFKNLQYWGQNLLMSSYTGINIFLWLYGCLLIFISLIFISSLVSFKKASTNIKNENIHRAHI
jgi:PilZ domain